MTKKPKNPEKGRKNKKIYRLKPCRKEESIELIINHVPNLTDFTELQYYVFEHLDNFFIMPKPRNDFNFNGLTTADIKEMLNIKDIWTD